MFILPSYWPVVKLRDSRNTLAKPQGKKFCQQFKTLLQKIIVILGKSAEHEIRQIPTLRTRAAPHPQTLIGRTDALLNGAQTIVPTMTAFATRPKTAKLKQHVVHHHVDILG